ncbi:hypothetical protein GCM10017771_61890 [Streptomyces capitiformicae]|uniref:Uncharacterized protein n=1 Tax=Streptomyces capitiformicae TaxID=2014920 RepID=A0A918Z937_9ACTN|nr:hypothetical protein GCM10017771_61890 [Streptomyces capitiformicae]
MPLLTVADLLTDDTPSGLVATESASAIAEKGDVVVAGVVRAFKAWLYEGPPTALGPQLYALRVDPAKLDAHFLAGCLHARPPTDVRQAPRLQFVAGRHPASAGTPTPFGGTGRVRRGLSRPQGIRGATRQCRWRRQGIGE